MSVIVQIYSPDWSIDGCAYCHIHAENEETGPANYWLNPPFGSLNAIDSVRVHDKCYWILINIVRAACQLPLVTGKEW